MATEAPLPIKVIRDVMIPMRDGVSLAANLYIPEEAGQYPAIFAFYPYLKDGYVGLEHEPHHRHFASRGYAALQVDFRGTGASGGKNPHPFDLQERADGYDVVEWLAVQPWCTGRVGIWGISYGGITSYSIAATRPPHLSAIVPLSGTIDNYEWLHRTHGCRGLLRSDVDFGPRMAASNLLPPVRQDPEGRWAQVWSERLEANDPWFFDWHGPPNVDFWQSRKIPYEMINVPTFNICSWNEGYQAPMFTVHNAVQAPKRILIGAWKHTLPDVSPLHPVGVVHEINRWWDRWLKDVPNGVENEPPVTISVMGGAWRHETEWPIARTTPRRLFLGDDHRLVAEASGFATADAYEYNACVGLGSIAMDAHRSNLAIPDDQSYDDHLSLSYTDAPLPEDIEITGTPVAHVALSATTGELTLVAKLCVVSPDGRSRVISQGNANPARPDAHSEKRPLNSGEVRVITIDMEPTSIIVRAGDRLRLCLAGADFPELWPTPYPYRMEVHRGPSGGSWLDVPLVPPQTNPLPAPQLTQARDDLFGPTSEADFDLDVIHQHLSSRVVAFETKRTSRHHVDTDTVLDGHHHAVVTTDADRPWTTNLLVESRFELRRPGGEITVQVDSLLTPFAVKADAEIRIDGKLFFAKGWNKQIDEWSDEREI